MRTADEIIEEIGEINPLAMRQIRYRDKTCLSIENCVKIVIAAREEALKEYADCMRKHAFNKGQSFDNTPLAAFLKENK